MISVLVACGFPQPEICKRFKCDMKTLRKHCRAEIDEGKQIAIGHVANSLFGKAMGDGPQSVTACIFWLKTQAGWKEANILEVGGVGGGPVVLSFTDRDL